MKQTCILILGMHRSGTSALSGVLNILDVYLGSELMKPLEQNPKGFYENMLLYKVNEKILKEIGSGWDDVFYNEKKLCAIESVSELEHILREEFQYSQLFAIKDPRLAYLFPLYVQALSNLGVEIKVVIPFRNPLEVAASLKARNNFSQGKSFLLWAYHFLLSEKISRGFPRVFTRFDELVQSPKKVIELIDQKLELGISLKFESKQDQLEDFLAPDLKHHNISLGNLSENVPEIIRKIVDQAPCLNEVSLTEKFDYLRNQLFGNQSLFYNENIRSAIDELAHAKQGLQAKDQELAQAKQGLKAKDQELAQAKQGLQAKDQELAQAKQGLQAKDQELAQAKQGLQAKDQELAQAKQGLKAKDQELAQAKLGLQAKDQELAQAKQGLQAKDQELAQAKQGLQAKDQELAQAKQGLQAKDQELAQAKQGLQAKDQELAQAKLGLQAQNTEVNNLKNELTAVYMSNSWKVTRPLRKFTKKVGK